MDRLRKLPPPALLALMYLVLILIGTVVLQLPVSHDNSVGWMESFFTSTSAVTVTGLSVADTGTAFTPFGQVVIAALIQMGGLGLMTFAVLLLQVLGIPIGLPSRMVLREDLNQTSLSNLGKLAVKVMKIALIVEVIGALILALVFVPDFGWGAGAWHSVFHSISAFNNAGFSLFHDSLMSFATDPVINVVIPLLFIVSGLGFVVIGDIMRVRRWDRLAMHTKLMLVGTLALILWGSFSFAILEWSNPRTLGAYDHIWQKAMISWFQGVTPRTAGFNTIDTSAMHDETVLITITLMLIGGGSASTAGGIKVTTFIVLILAMIAFFRRHSELRVFGRSIGATEIMKVLALTTISLIVVMVSLFLLMVVQDGDFLRLSFEIASAFGTAGLSMGETGELNTAGRLIIIVVMFLGRVGPLTLGFFLATRSRPRVSYPEGQVYLG